MLGFQPNFVLSPPANLNAGSKLGKFANSGVGTTGVGNTGTCMDERSIKDIIEILNKQISNTKNLTEFSQVLQVPNIS